MKEKWKMRAVTTLLLSMTLCMGSLAGCQKQEAEVSKDALKTTLFRVGKADAIVLETDGKAMVIDVGEEEDGEEIVEYLHNQHISKVETLIITHYDHDHVGGADTLVEAFDVDRILVPAYEGANVESVDFQAALEAKELEAEQLTEPVQFSFGNAEVLVEPPSAYEVNNTAAEMDNNFSLITTVTHGKNKLLFTGDAEKWRIRDWLSKGTVSQCDFLKVPHHGVYNTAMRELLEIVKPEYAVICSSNKNPADSETLELLKETNIGVFQTKDGNVTVISDGNKLEVDQTLERE